MAIITTLVFEDCTLIAERDKVTQGYWSGHSYDTFSGKVQSFEGWTDHDMAAIVYATHCGGEMDPRNIMASNAAYDIASDLVKDWPSECRPFP